MNFLAGYKTYCVAVLLGLVTIAQALSYITPETATVLQGLLVSGGLASLRSAIK